MSDYDNTNRGVLFKNDRKDSEKHPDYTGKMNVEGQERYLSAWIKEGKSGKFMSLSLGKPVEQKGKPSEHDTKKGNGYAPEKDDFVDDLIPF